MKYLALIAILLTGCGTTAHVGVYHDFAGDVDTKGSNPAAVGWIEKRFTDDIACQYMHFSHYFSGWPFNHDPESTADLLGCSARVW